jgi:hypothetical protein
MKKKFGALSIAFLLFATAHAQDNVKYKILNDDPSHPCNLVIGIDLMQMDCAFRNIDGISFSAGVWGFVDYKNRYGFDYILRYGYLTLGRLNDAELKSHRQIELGGYLTLSSNLVSTKSKIVLKVTDDGKTETTNYVMVPSTHLKRFGLRGGFMNYAGVLNTESAVKEGGAAPEFTNLNVIGFYAGLFKSRTMNVLITTDNYGKKGISKSSRFYLDALVCPVRTAKYGDVNYRDNLKGSPLGWRLGWEVFPVLTRQERKPDYPIRICFQTEVGMRPYEGLFITGTLTFAISRHLEKLSDGPAKTIQKETE